jgi:hypothetical protein
MSLGQRMDSYTTRRSMVVARRRSRRSFLARTGQAAVALVGAGMVESRLVGTAQAHHFCGHTGTTGTCSGGVCNYTSGGCWYACCSGCGSGRIRKICDCCRSGYSGGYCPSGTGVYCVYHRCTSGLC